MTSERGKNSSEEMLDEACKEMSKHAKSSFRLQARTIDRVTLVAGTIPPGGTDACFGYLLPRAKCMSVPAEMVSLFVCLLEFEGASTSRSFCAHNIRFYPLSVKKILPGSQCHG